MFQTRSRVGHSSVLTEIMTSQNIKKKHFSAITKVRGTSYNALNKIKFYLDSNFFVTNN